MGMGVEPPPPGFGTSPRTSASVAAPVLTENTTVTVMRYDKKVGAKVEKVHILPSCRKALKCMALEMKMKYAREVEESERFQKRPPQPLVRPGWTACIPAGYFVCPYECGWAQKRPWVSNKKEKDIHLKKCWRQRGEFVWVTCDKCGSAR